MFFLGAYDSIFYSAGNRAWLFASCYALGACRSDRTPFWRLGYDRWRVIQKLGYGRRKNLTARLASINYDNSPQGIPSVSFRMGMVEMIDRTKGLQAMIFLRNIVSAALLIAAFGISVISLTTLLGSLVFSTRAPSTCFFPVLALCIASCGLHSEPMPTWFCLAGVVTVSIALIEIATRGVNLVCKQIKHKSSSTVASK